MAKKSFYEIGPSEGYLREGFYLEVRRQINYRGDRADFKPFLNVPVKDLEKQLKESQAEEKKVFEEMKKAVHSGYWNLFRYNPAAPAGKKFTLDCKEPAGGYQEFLMNEARYSRLTREFPERAAELFERNEEAAIERYNHLVKLKELYAED